MPKICYSIRINTCNATVLKAKIMFLSEANYYYGVYNGNGDFVRIAVFFLRIKM